MKRTVLLVLALFTINSLTAQDANDANKQGRELLTKGDTKNAVPLIRKAAELGHPEAQYNYGYCYQKGVEVERNDSIANIWLLKSASQGWLDAQFKIAYSYASGRGIKQDYTKALYWSLQCAEQNDPECMSNVIGCYTDGMGTTKNKDSALAWTVRLASLPDVENLQQSGFITNARIALAMHYRDGQVYPHDKIKSYMWFLIYNESKRDFSVLNQQDNIEAIKELGESLSASEKIKATQEAEKQINRKLKNLDKLYKVDM